MRSHTRAFSLFEVAISLLLVGLIAGGAMTLFNASGRQQCYLETKQTLEQARQAVEQYAMSNERYPMPARRQVDSRSGNYGREVPLNAGGNVSTDLDTFVITNAADGTVGATMVYGAFPFATVGTSVRLAEDCWGNKLTYVVTKDLTNTTKFDNATDGAFDIKTDVAHTHAQAFLKGAGFAIISHGADGLGAVKVNYSGTTKNWCTYDAANWGKTENCDVTNNVLISRAYSDGKDAAGTYYDDLITFKGKPWKISTQNTNVYCWGNNSSGMLGTGSTGLVKFPAQVLNGPGDFVTISSGDDHTCGLTTAGKAYCWGRDDDGQIGINGALGSNVVISGTHRFVTAPMPVEGNHVFTAISSGSNHTCALKASGEVWCWGDGIFGQLGYGSTLDKKIPVKVVYTGSGATPIFTQIDAGGNNTCATASNNKMYCWGTNSDGNIGSGACCATAEVYAKLPVATPAGVTYYSKVSVGSGGSACALANDGRAYCWGSNTHNGDFGHLGVGDFTYGSIQIPTAVLGGITFADITAGNNHFCGITTAGATYCWGITYESGAVGNGTCSGAPCYDSEAPTLVVGGNSFVSVTGGANRSFGLTAAGVVYAWGDGGDALGKGSPGGTPSPTPGTVHNAPPSFMMVNAGSSRTCGIVGTPPTGINGFNGGWGSWTTCSGACNGGLGSQTRTCSLGVGNCAGGAAADTQTCYNLAPCNLYTGSGNSGPWTAFTYPVGTPQCPYMGGCASNKSTIIFSKATSGYVCSPTSSGHRRYEWQCAGSVGSSYYCQSGEYHDASFPLFPPCP